MLHALALALFIGKETVALSWIQGVSFACALKTAKVIDVDFFTDFDLNSGLFWRSISGGSTDDIAKTFLIEAVTDDTLVSCVK